MNLQFPSKEIIISYLAGHPLTNKDRFPCLTDKKIIEAIADFFDNAKKLDKGVDFGVMRVLHDLNKNREIPEKKIAIIHFLLITALKECANEKNREPKKQDTFLISKL